MRAPHETGEQDWREALLQNVLLVTTPAIAVSDIISILTSRGLDRLFLQASVATTLWSAAAIYRRTWRFWLRGLAMLSPLILGVFVVYVRVGFKGNASAIATVVVVLTGLLFGRRKMALAIISFSLLAVLVGTAMCLNVMPWQPLRVAEMDRPSNWIRAVSTAVLCWVIAGGAVTFVVERVERSLRETRQALAALRAEQRRREEVDVARQRAMEALVRAQRTELAGQLAAGVAHDFNNVLNVISLWSSVMTRSSRSGANDDHVVRALANAQQQGRALSQQMMDLARPEVRSVTRFPLDRPIHGTLLTLKPALPPGIQLRFEALAAPEVEASETEIQQIVYNLVLNARDAMPGGGTIQVTAGVETTQIPVQVVGGELAAGPWATLTVKDTGLGIDPAIRDRIFDLFFTTKGSEGGTGLGLATVLRIAQARGGGVALDTDAGRGATFKVYLPCN
jgi:signal transduction histidine kinase